MCNCVYCVCCITCVKGCRLLKCASSVINATEFFIAHDEREVVTRADKGWGVMYLIGLLCLCSYFSSMHIFISSLMMHEYPSDTGMCVLPSVVLLVFIISYL